jgi:YbgC/YbaW family acyl-CoA thioester hydrolase
MAFTYPVTARFHEVDRAGIIFFATIFSYCHITFEELIIERLGSFEEAVGRRGWGLPVVHTEADYFAPIRVGDRLNVSLCSARIGKTSVNFAYEVVGVDGVLRAKVRIVQACIDLQSFRPRSVASELVEALRSAGVDVPEVTANS